MTRIFISYAKENANCAEEIRKGFETRSYIVWQEAGYFDPESTSYQDMSERAILGSAAVVLIWSSAAARAEWVMQHILFAQRLKKPLFIVLLDNSLLPSILMAVSPIIPHASCDHVVPELMALLDFPRPDTTSSLMMVYEQAAHEFLSWRKDAVATAAEMLIRGENREAILALLLYLAHHDLMMGVREKAQAVLDAEQRKTEQASPPDEAQHIFGVRCKNGHVSYFDKRSVCPTYLQVPRNFIRRQEKKLDELYLKCETCRIEVVAHVDCEAYK